MKLMSAWITVSVLWFTAPAITPMNTFSISLCSVPVHCVTLDIPFLKCWRPGKFDIALKNTSSCFANQGGASQYEVILKDSPDINWYPPHSLCLGHAGISMVTAWHTPESPHSHYYESTPEQLVSSQSLPRHTGINYPPLINHHLLSDHIDHVFVTLPFYCFMTNPYHF